MLYRWSSLLLHAKDSWFATYGSDSDGVTYFSNREFVEKDDRLRGKVFAHVVAPSLVIGDHLLTGAHS